MLLSILLLFKHLNQAAGVNKTEFKQKPSTFSHIIPTELSYIMLSLFCPGARLWLHSGPSNSSSIMASMTCHYYKWAPISALDCKSFCSRETISECVQSHKIRLWKPSLWGMSSTKQMVFVICILWLTTEKKSSQNPPNPRLWIFILTTQRLPTSSQPFLSPVCQVQDNLSRPSQVSHRVTRSLIVICIRQTGLSI